MNHKPNDSSNNPNTPSSHDSPADPHSPSQDQRSYVHSPAFPPGDPRHRTRGPNRWVTRLVYAATITGFTALAASHLTKPAYARLTPGHQRITQSIQEAGFTLHSEGEHCEPHVMAYVNTKSKDFVLCANNLKFYELIHLAIRHEAIHVAQVCNNNTPITGPLANWFVSVAQNPKYGLDPALYDPETLHYEGEAFVLANLLSADEVNAMVRSACGLD